MDCVIGLTTSLGGDDMSWKVNDFYVPRTKIGLIKSIMKFLPEKRKLSVLTKKQLYAMYYKIRNNNAVAIGILLMILCFGNVNEIQASGENALWKVTAYCPCKICCGKYSDGRTASNKLVKKGYCANNWIKFGTKIKIDGLDTVTVEDRGSKRYFGTKEEKRKAIDILFMNHEQAKKFGVKFLKVRIME